MIDKQAIDTMTKMLAVISKYAKGAYPEVETEASSENRRRAWTVTKMLARLAENAAGSDFYFLLSDDVNNTDAERKRCYQIARQEDRGFMDELHNFQKRAAEYEGNPVIEKNRTDGDIIRELECLLQNVRVLQKMQEGSAESSALKVTKKERERRDASRAVIEENLASVKHQLAITEKLALARGMLVSLNRHRTVIKRMPALTQATKPAAAATKAKKAPVMTLVATKPNPQREAETSTTKKSA